MTAALDVSSSQRTQATRQDAITERIADLEAKAAKAEALGVPVITEQQFADLLEGGLAAVGL